MPSIFDAPDYRAFLKAALDSPEHARGGRTRLAAHLGVQPSFVSTVLAGKQDFSPEHGIRLGAFFGLDEEEREWLVLLISRDRAGSADLRSHYERQLARRRAERRKIRAQIRPGPEIDAAALGEYYGAWYTVAVHMCVRNPKLREPEAIARALGVGRKGVLRALRTLEKIGFVRRSQGKWLPREARFHLSRNSPALRSHLHNWRNQAIHAIDEFGERNLHYSLVLSVDDPAIERIRELLLELIKNVEPILEKAGDERVVALNLDYFLLTGADRSG